MGWLTAIRHRAKAPKSARETAAATGVDWNAFVDRSLVETAREQSEKTAQHIATKPAVAALEEPKLGLVPLVAIVGAGAALLIFAVVGIGHLTAPETAIHFRASLAPSPLASRVPDIEPSVRSSEPISNRDPLKPPGEGYVWVNESTDRNGIHRNGHWRSRPK